MIVSDFRSGEICSTITRDSGNIPYLFEKDQEIFICSTNGSIRTFMLTHTGQNIKMVRYLAPAWAVPFCWFVHMTWMMY